MGREASAMKLREYLRAWKEGSQLFLHLSNLTFALRYEFVDQQYPQRRSDEFYRNETHLETLRNLAWAALAGTADDPEKDAMIDSVPDVEMQFFLHTSDGWSAEKRREWAAKGFKDTYTHVSPSQSSVDRA
jgi:hypothetical protein